MSSPVSSLPNVGASAPAEIDEDRPSQAEQEDSSQEVRPQVAATLGLAWGFPGLARCPSQSLLQHFLQDFLRDDPISSNPMTRVDWQPLYTHRTDFLPPAP